MSRGDNIFLICDDTATKVGVVHYKGNLEWMINNIGLMTSHDAVLEGHRAGQEFIYRGEVEEVIGFC